MIRLKGVINIGTGGTWLSQDKVFRFKKKWGACSTKYYYYTSIFNKEILNIKDEVLSKEYPFFHQTI